MSHKLWQTVATVYSDKAAHCSLQQVPTGANKRSHCPTGTLKWPIGAPFVMKVSWWKFGRIKFILWRQCDSVPHSGGYHDGSTLSECSPAKAVRLPIGTSVDSSDPFDLLQFLLSGFLFRTKCLWSVHLRWPYNLRILLWNQRTPKSLDLKRLNGIDSMPSESWRWPPDSTPNSKVVWHLQDTKYFHVLSHLTHLHGFTLCEMISLRYPAVCRPNDQTLEQKTGTPTLNDWSSNTLNRIFLLVFPFNPLHVLYMSFLNWSRQLFTNRFSLSLSSSKQTERWRSAAPGTAWSKRTNGASLACKYNRF